METREPDIVYHYTNEKGLVDILTTQTLWCTDYSTLDDKLEFIIYVDYILTRLDQKPDIFYDKSKIRLFIKALSDIYHQMIGNPNDPKVYVTSFCQSGDSPNLWNKFGDYSIGFDYENIDKIRKEEYKKYNLYEVLFESVVYYDKIKIPKKLEQKTDEIINCVNIDFGGSKNNRLKCIATFIECIPLFKKPDLEYENEYRLVVVTPLKSGESISGPIKKVKDNGHKKYIELFDDSEIILPIREIIIGPKIDYESKCDMLKKLLLERGIDPEIIKISKSSLPLVQSC